MQTTMGDLSSATRAISRTVTRLRSRRTTPDARRNSPQRARRLAADCTGWGCDARTACRNSGDELHRVLRILRRRGVSRLHRRRLNFRLTRAGAELAGQGFRRRASSFSRSSTRASSSICAPVSRDRRTTSALAPLPVMGDSAMNRLLDRWCPARTAHPIHCRTISSTSGTRVARRAGPRALLASSQQSFVARIQAEIGTASRAIRCAADHADVSCRRPRLCLRCHLCPAPRS